MMEQDKLKQGIKTLTHSSYIVIGKHIDCVRELCNMSVDVFSQKLGNELGYAERTVRDYPTKGVTGEVDCQKLLSSLWRIMESTIESEELTGTNDVLYISPLYCIAFTYEIIDFFKSTRHILSDNIQMRMLTERIANELCSEAELINRRKDHSLQKSLQRYRSMKSNTKVITKAVGEIKSNYGEIVDDKKPFRDVMHDRAWKRLVGTVLEIS